jgi:hypothetical protein
LHRHLHGGSGRQPVVDDDGGLARHVERWSIAPVGRLPADQLATLLLGDALDVGRRDAHPADDVVVGAHRSATRNRSHREFRLVRHPQLAHDVHVERGTQRRRHFECNGDAAAGEADHDDRRIIAVVPKQPGEHSTGLAPVPKGFGTHGARLPDGRTVRLRFAVLER